MSHGSTSSPQKILGKITVFNTNFSFRPNQLITILLLSSLIVRLLFRSQWLDCWDSVQFSLALTDYSVPNHQPHPPGFPVYIGMGRIIAFFLNDPQQSLVLISIISGVASIYLTYVLGSKLYNEYVGLIAAFLLSISPAHMQFSVVVMADIVNLFIVILVLTLIILGLDKQWQFYLGSVTLGLSFGIRPTDSAILFLAIFLFIVFCRRKIIAHHLAYTFGGSLIWFVPFVIYNDSYEFLNVSLAHLETSHNVSSLASGGLLNAIEDFITCFIDGWSISIVALGLITIIGVILLRTKFDPNEMIKGQHILLALWSILFSVYCIYSLYLYTPRYVLPLFPIASIVFASSILYIYHRIKQQSNVATVLAIICIIMVCIPMMFSSLIIINGLHNVKPAPVDAAFYIKENYPPNNTVVLSRGSFRHFQYYLPDYQVINMEHITDNTLQKVIISNNIVISEGDDMSWGSPSVNFTRNKKIYPKHEYVKLYIHNNSEQNYWHLSGWHDLEIWQNVPTRWMSHSATLLIYTDDSGPAVLQFKAMSYHRERTLKIYHNDRMIREQSVPQHFTELSVPLPLQEGVNIICLEIPEGCDKPSQVSGSKDTRRLSVAVQNIKLAKA